MNNKAQAAARRTAVAAHQSGQSSDALEMYTRYLADYPTDASIWTNLGVLFRSSGQYEMARIAQVRAFGLAPDDKGVLNNYANILSDLGAYETSIDMRLRSLAIDPNNENQHAMIGKCYRGMGRYQDAIDYLTPQIAAFPHEHEIPLQIAFAQLGDGQHGAGFRNYDARWSSDEVREPKAPFTRWVDGMSIEGKTILILPEQGFGDMVQLVRFIPIVVAMGAKVRLVAKKPLLRLLDGIEGVEWIGTAASKDDPIDLWITIMELPKLVFGPKDNGVVPPPAKLTIPKESTTRAKELTAQHGNMFKVGVVWSGSATYKGNAFRSFSHREFLSLADVANVQLFSLYKGPYLEAFNKDGSAALIVDAASTDRDFADCAATMLEMDLVITSDTATAHIAGSLGIPVWVIVHWDAFWVYGHSGDTTPWYPSMRIFRQQKPLDWASAFDAVRAALVERVACDD